MSPHLLDADFPCRLSAQEAPPQPKPPRTVRLEGDTPPGGKDSRLLASDGRPPPGTARKTLRALPSLATFPNEGEAAARSRLPTRRARDLRALQATGAGHHAGTHRAKELFRP